MTAVRLESAGFFHFDRVLPMRNIDAEKDILFVKSLFRKLLGPAACGLAAFGGSLLPPLDVRAADDKKDPPIVIRPANFDPADELAYTRQRGELSQGAVADGTVWNKPPENSRAAVSSEAPAPANAGGQGP